MKNARLLRYARHSSLRRTQKYASFLMTSDALHPDIFDQSLRRRGLKAKTSIYGIALTARHCSVQKSLFISLLAPKKRTKEKAPS
jgi:hypothetical protein